VIVLDTDILTIVQRAEGEEHERLVERLDAVGNEEVCTSIILFEEQMRGWLAWIARARTLDRQAEAYGKLRALLEDFQTRPVLDFEGDAIGRFRDLARQRIRIGTMDLKIAAIVLAQDALLLSRNLSDFRKVPGLRVEDWTVRTDGIQ
jgi:tRNA(fMet)-specific endonuclease VapC